MSGFGSMSPAERSLAGRAAALKRWSQTDDRRAATAPARAGQLARFERQVDPDGSLAPDERARRAEMARRAHMANMQRLAAKAKRERAANPQ